MKIIKGEYENGVIKPLQEVSGKVCKNVLITFLEEDDEQEIVINISSHQLKKFFYRYLSNERKDLYQEFLNKDNDSRRILSKQLRKESKLVQNESMKVLKEFERLENED